MLDIHKYIERLKSIGYSKDAANLTVAKCISNGTFDILDSFLSESITAKTLIEIL